MVMHSLMNKAVYYGLDCHFGNYSFIYLIRQNNTDVLEIIIRVCIRKNMSLYFICKYYKT